MTFSTLHLWNTAGVASILAKFGRRAGFPQTVIYSKSYDPYGIGRYYGDTALIGPPHYWYVRALTTILSQRPELIVIHGIHKHPWLWRRIAPHATIVLVGHGTEVRLGHISGCMSKHFDRLTVTTPDLQQYIDATYMPNPVDTDLFNSGLFNGGHAANGRGLYRLKPGQTRRALMAVLGQMGFGHIDWKQVPHTPYDKMPELLAKHEYVADLSMLDGSEMVAPMHSTLGLQAMSMGCKVVCHDGMVRDTLPEEHEPERCWRRYARLRTTA